MSKIFLRKHIGAFVLFLLGSSLFSQESGASKNFADIHENFLADYVSRTWTSAEGLPANSVTDIIQDSKGYLYFGTYEGLVRFDGLEFVTLNRSYDPKYDFVAARSLFQDSLGTIWVGSNDDGLIGIHESGTVEKYTVENGLPNNSIRAICEDRDQNIWVGTASGIVYLKKSGNVNERTPIRPVGLEQYGEENILVFDIYCDTAGRIWVANSKPNGIFVYSNLMNSFSRYEGIKSIENPTVDCIMQDKSGAFWFGIAPHYAVRIDGDGETSYDIGQGRQDGTSVNKIYQDNNANIWFATENGVIILRNGKFHYFNSESKN